MKKITKLLTYLFGATWLSCMLVLVGNLSVQGETCDPLAFSCPSSICKLKIADPDFCKRVNCVGITPNSCPEGSEYEEGLTMCGCCSGCAAYLQIGDACEWTSFPPEMSLENCLGPVCTIKMRKCSPGLSCSADECRLPNPKPDKLDCNFGRTLSKNNLLHWEPQCEPDGTYSPKQCKGTVFDGLCYCANKDGDRIFGREWYGKAENQTCACSRKVYELREQGNIATIHCTSDGNFEPLQCDMESGLCYCVDTITGETNAAVVPENQWKTLPCFNRTYWGEEAHYLRKCESSWAAWKKLNNEARLHGLHVFAGDTSLCDFDGSFAPKQPKNNRDTCVYKNDEQIGGYFAQQGVQTDMNCICARDTILAQEEKRPFTLKCDKNTGNYAKTSPYRDDIVRCVDNDGFFFGPTDVTKDDECCLQGNCKTQVAKDECKTLKIPTCDELYS